MRELAPSASLELREKGLMIQHYAGGAGGLAVGSRRSAVSHQIAALVAGQKQNRASDSTLDEAAHRRSDADDCALRQGAETRGLRAACNDLCGGDRCVGGSGEDSRGEQVSADIGQDDTGDAAD